MDSVVQRSGKNLSAANQPSVVDIPTRRKPPLEPNAAAAHQRRANLITRPARWVGQTLADEMSADRSHAFAEGTTFPAPERMPSDDPRRVTAEAVWGAFREVSRISPDALLGPRAWPNNLRQNPDYMAIGPQTVVRGVLRVERLGYISIDDHCYIGDGVIVSAHAGIAIAPDVLIAHGCQIFDNVSHPLGWQERARHYRAAAALPGDAYRDGQRPLRDAQVRGAGEGSAH